MLTKLLMRAPYLQVKRWSNASGDQAFGRTGVSFLATGVRRALYSRLLDTRSPSEHRNKCPDAARLVLNGKNFIVIHQYWLLISQIMAYVYLR